MSKKYEMWRGKKYERCWKYNLPCNVKVVLQQLADTKTIKTATKVGLIKTKIINKKTINKQIMNTIKNTRRLFQ